MVQIPEKFNSEFGRKGEKFFQIAEVLYNNPDWQFTQDELAEIIGRSNTIVSNHTSEMVECGWLTRREHQTTYSWDTSTFDPSHTEGTTAVKRFYVDLWRLLKQHSKTAPGIFSILGFACIVAGIVIFAFYLGFSSGLTQKSEIPLVVYLSTSLGLLLTGAVTTILSPLQAYTNRLLSMLCQDRQS